MKSYLLKPFNFHIVFFRSLRFKLNFRQNNFYFYCVKKKISRVHNPSVRFVIRVIRRKCATLGISCIYRRSNSPSSLGKCCKINRVISRSKSKRFRRERKYMHPPLARALPFTIFFVDPTARGRKEEKEKKYIYRNALSTSQRRRRIQDDRRQRFFSAAPATYLSGRLLFRSWGPPSLRSRGTFVRVSRRMHFCPERERPRERNKV